MAHYADISAFSEEENALWDMLLQNQNQQFFTVKKLAFTYYIRGNELFISRREKSLTRSTIHQAYHKAKELMKTEGKVSGPKKLGTFGASYLFSIFCQLNIIQ